MGTHPAQPPTLYVTHPAGNIVRSIIEAAGADFAAILLHDGARCYIRSGLSDAERQVLLEGRDESTVLTIADRPFTPAPPALLHAQLGPMLSTLAARGLRWLHRSPHDKWPRNLSELVEDRAQAETELCRDDDCSGRHAWLAHHRPGDGRVYWFIWHLDLRSGNIVPPTPLELR